ncbi:MAG: hypothetical protein JXQ29_14890 [Planctomycetes bacterium]|nr:hypothetical protein [Planctomycetota bacterium]
MREIDLRRLFEGLADAGEGGREECGPDCLAPEEIEAIAAGRMAPDPDRLARIAACGACSAALRVLLELRDAAGSAAPAPVRLPSTRVQRWRRRLAPVAAAAAVLVMALWWLGRGGGDSRGLSPLRLEDDRVVLWADGRVWSEEGAVRIGQRLPAGARVHVAPGSRVALLDPAGGEVAIRPGDLVAAGSAPLVALARELGPDRAVRRRQVAELFDGVVRAERPDFVGLAPRGAVRSDRPEFRFQSRHLGPEDELILRVVDEEGVMRLEHRFRGLCAVAFPAEGAALARARRYVWSIHHPRSGPGALGGEPFGVVGTRELEAVDGTLAGLERLRGHLPAWLVDVLGAIALRQGGLQSEALAALPAEVPDLHWRRFVLEERALLLDQLGLSEQVGPLKRVLEAAPGR